MLLYYVYITHTCTYTHKQLYTYLTTKPVITVKLDIRIFITIRIQSTLVTISSKSREWTLTIRTDKGCMYVYYIHVLYIWLLEIHTYNTCANGTQITVQLPCSYHQYKSRQVCLDQHTSGWSYSFVLGLCMCIYLQEIWTALMHL